MNRQTKTLNKFIVTVLIDGTRSLSQIQLATGASLNKVISSLEILERSKYVCKSEKRGILYFSVTKLGRNMLQISNRL